MTDVLLLIRRTTLAQDRAGLTDGQLLDCFVVRRDASAFEALVRRHGPMVWGVCRRIAGHLQDAEDAFQATFLILVRKAASLRARELVGNWLYGVACHTAMKARTASARRRAKERPVQDMPQSADAPTEVWEELQPLLDAELARLPEKYRVPVVLCELEGRARKDVAQQLGVPEGTLSSRLAAARRMLAKRLRCRGVVLSLAMLTSLLAQQAKSASLPAPLLGSTVEAAALIAARQTPARLISARVAALTEGVLKGMLLTKLKIAAMVPLLGVIALGGIGLFVQANPRNEQQGARKNSPAKSSAKDTDPEPRAADMEKLQGTWVVEQVEYGGEKRPQPSAGTVTFTRDKVAWQQKSLFREGTFKLDATKRPREIDWTLGEFVPVKMPGVYRFEGDKLILSMGPDDHFYPDSRRPTEFTTKEKDSHWVYTLKRQPAKAKDQPKGEAAKRQEARQRCSSAMHQIMLAMHNYQDKYGHFPHPSISDKDGKPLLSWRVALLPQLGYDELYKQFKLDEPWDSEHNKKLLADIPKVYAPLSLVPKDDHATFYQVFVGNGAAFEEKTDITINDIFDGTSGTIFLVEAWEAVPWTKPADLPYDPAKELPMLGGMIGDGLFTFVLGDGSVYTTKNVVDATLMRALITRNGGEVVNLEDLDR
jgi:RNA polymerase sigma-70 factor (ECF subfamily)